MIKILSVMLLLTLAKADAQQLVTSNMTGRWRHRSQNYSGDMQFISDGKIAFLSLNGMLFGYILYTSEIKDSVIRLKYTVDIDRKNNRQYQHTEMKFLNDSVMLYTHSKLPAWANTETKGISIYRKLKRPIPANNQLRLPNYIDLAGTWIFPFKGKIVDRRIVFIEEGHATFQKDSISEPVTYKIDYTKQPSPIDFYHPLTGKTEQALFQFANDNGFRIEWFSRDPPDHFTALGFNNWYVRESTYHPANANKNEL